MLIAIKIVAIACIAVLVGVLTNQLPALRDFKGKTGLLIRLIVWLTLIAAAHEILGSEASEQAKVMFRYGGVAAAVD